jgi:hypothetical protein
MAGEVEEDVFVPEDEAEKDDGAERISEAWRSNPVFLREEVNVTRLGECIE